MSKQLHIAAAASIFALSALALFAPHMHGATLDAFAQRSSAPVTPFLAATGGGLTD